jgi:chitinase
MKRITFCVAAALLLVTSAESRSAAAPSQKWVSGFYVGWQTDAYPPTAVDFSSLTHVMVFAVLPHEDGTLDTSIFVDPVNGPVLAQRVAQLAHNAGKKAILTVGGSGTGRAFSGATAQNMAAFVQKLTSLLSGWGFDGIDIDWEPLAPADYAAVMSLVQQLRAAQPGMIITVDVGWQNTNFKLAGADAQFYRQLAPLVDQLNMMNYGMADNWGGWVVWHSSALYGEGPDHPSSVASSAKIYLDAGVPASKLGMGIGFFGSCWNWPARAPLQQTDIAHVVSADNDMSSANVRRLYYHVENYHYDSVAQAPYLSFDNPAGAKQCTFISYEDETSVTAKGQYAQEAGLGGTIIWQLNEGYNPNASDPSSLLHAVGSAFLPDLPKPPAAPANLRIAR